MKNSKVNIRRFRSFGMVRLIQGWRYGCKYEILGGLRGKLSMVVVGFYMDKKFRVEPFVKDIYLKKY